MGGIVVAQGLVVLVLGVAALAFEVWALVEATRFRKEAYVAAGKQTKVLWLCVLAVAALVGFYSYANPLGIGIFAFAAAAVFMAGVRPALRSLQGRGGRGSAGGPYGGW